MAKLADFLGKPDIRDLRPAEVTEIDKNRFFLTQPNTKQSAANHAQIITGRGANQGDASQINN